MYVSRSTEMDLAVPRLVHVEEDTRKTVNGKRQSMNHFGLVYCEC